MITITMILPSHVDFAGVLVRQYIKNRPVIYEGDGIIHRQLMSGADVLREGPQLTITFPVPVTTATATATIPTSYPIVVNTYNLLGELGPDVVYPTGIEEDALSARRHYIAWAEDFSNGGPLVTYDDGLGDDLWQRRGVWEYMNDYQSSGYSALATMNWYDRTHADFALESGADQSLVPSSSVIAAPDGWTGAPPEAWIVFNDSIPNTYGPAITRTTGGHHSRTWSSGAHFSGDMSGAVNHTQARPFLQYPTNCGGISAWGGQMYYYSDFLDKNTYPTGVWSLMSVIGSGKFAANSTNLGLKLDFYADAQLAPTPGSAGESAFVLYSFAESSQPIYQWNVPFTAFAYTLGSSALKYVTLRWWPSTWAWPGSINSDGVVNLEISGYFHSAFTVSSQYYRFVNQVVDGIKVHFGWGSDAASSNTVGAVRFQPCKRLWQLQISEFMPLDPSPAPLYPLLYDRQLADVVNNTLIPLVDPGDTTPGFVSTVAFAQANYIPDDGPANYSEIFTPANRQEYRWIKAYGGLTEVILEFDLTFDANDYWPLASDGGHTYCTLAVINSEADFWFEMWDTGAGTNDWLFSVSWNDNGDGLIDDATTPFLLSSIVGTTQHFRISFVCSTKYFIADQYGRQIMYTNPNGSLSITMGTTTLFALTGINICFPGARSDVWSATGDRYSTNLFYQTDIASLTETPNNNITGEIFLVRIGSSMAGVYDNFRLSYVQ